MKNSIVVLALALLGASPVLAQTTPSSSSVSGNPSGNMLKGQAPSGTTSSTGSTNSPTAADGTPSTAKAQAGNASFSKNATPPATTPTRKTKSKM